MRGVSCDADATVDVGGGVFVLPLRVTARGILIQKELVFRLNDVFCGGGGEKWAKSSKNFVGA